MKHWSRKNVLEFAAAAWLLAAFVLYTAIVRFVDIQPIGPMDSSVGLGGLNAWGAALLNGFHPLWYGLTEGLGALAFAVVGCFALLGVSQLIRRRSLAAVDADLYVLAGFYALVACAYVFFEVVTVNYRPVMLEAELEASYPSSHTMLALCVFVTAAMQLRSRLQPGALRGAAVGIFSLLAAVTVIGRWLSGVHWTTDILGGVLLSAALIAGYRAAVHMVKRHADA